MITVQFKLDYASTAVSFSAVSVTPDYEIEEDNYTDVDWERKKRILAKWKKWIIQFGLLSVSDQDYLLSLAAEEAPQFIYNSVTYDVEITDLKAKHQKGSITVIDREPQV